MRAGTPMWITPPPTGNRLQRARSESMEKIYWGLGLYIAAVIMVH